MQRAFRGQPFYRRFAVATISSLIRWRGREQLSSQAQEQLRDATIDCLQRGIDLPDHLEHRFLRLVRNLPARSNRSTHGRDYRVRSWHSLGYAAERFEEIGPRRKRERQPHAYYLAQDEIGGLDFYQPGYGRSVRRLHRDILPAIPRGAPSCEVAWKLLMLFRPKNKQHVNGQDVIHLLDRTADQFCFNMPEAFEMMRCRPISGAIEAEHPGETIVRGAHILTKGARSAYVQGQAYNILASTVHSGSSQFMKELNWLRDVLTDYEKVDGTAYHYLRYAALDCFVEQVDRCRRDDERAALIEQAISALEKFDRRKHFFDSGDRIIAQEGIDQLNGMRQGNTR